MSVSRRVSEIDQNEYLSFCPVIKKRKIKTQYIPLCTVRIIYFIYYFYCPKYIKIIYTDFFSPVLLSAFVVMIVLACLRLGKGEGQGRPAVANIDGVPSLFGVCVYSFMCHHSLPSMVTPIRNKSKLFGVMLADYGTILAFYLVLR